MILVVRKYAEGWRRRQYMSVSAECVCMNLVSFLYIFDTYMGDKQGEKMSIMLVVVCGPLL